MALFALIQLICIHTHDLTVLNDERNDIQLVCATVLRRWRRLLAALDWC